MQPTSRSGAGGRITGGKSNLEECSQKEKGRNFWW